MDRCFILQQVQELIAWWVAGVHGNWWEHKPRPQTKRQTADKQNPVSHELSHVTSMEHFSIQRLIGFNIKFNAPVWVRLKSLLNPTMVTAGLQTSYISAVLCALTCTSTLGSQVGSAPAWRQVLKEENENKHSYRCRVTTLSSIISRGGSWCDGEENRADYYWISHPLEARDMTSDEC